LAQKLGGGQPPAPHLAVIHHIIVQQRGGVHEFDGSRELDMTVAGIAAELGHGEREQWPQALAAGRNEIIGNFRYARDLRAGARQNRHVDPLHVLRQEPRQPVDS
jgi:hypothetical protein